VRTTSKADASFARATAAGIALGVLALLPCGCGPQVSDTGYEGTWQRGNERARSTIEIVKRGDEYLFRWSVDSTEGGRVVHRDWEGSCEEFVDGVKTSEYTFRTWTTPAGLLRVECKGKMVEPEPAEVHYIDQLRVKPGGRTLTVATLEQDGDSFREGKKPRRTFTKVSDAVGDPPQPAG
jgi:hypothetical protein